MPMRTAIRLSVFVVALTSCISPAEPKPLRPAADAKIVTSDIAAFWTAFDQITSSTDTMPLRRYIDDGSVGLKDFTRMRWKDAATLTRVVWTQRAYYASIRNTSLAAGQVVEPEVRAAFRVADTLIDRADFPDVYFTIGWLATGGTASSHGLLIGVELFSLAPDSPLDALSPWQKAVVRSNEALPAVVAHELVHFQQSPSGSTLLAQAIREGAADFVGGILTGHTINESIATYGLEHEEQLWGEFKVSMHGTDVSSWLYNGGSVTESSTRPADLGYFIGARIAEAYYNKAASKHQAVQDILHIRDYSAFLTASGYDGHP